MKVLKIGFIIFCLLILKSFAVAQTVADYLILNDIGTYAKGVEECRKKLIFQDLTPFIRSLFTSFPLLLI
jgi:hypothetical protein